MDDQQDFKITDIQHTFTPRMLNYPLGINLQYKLYLHILLWYRYLTDIYWGYAICATQKAVTKFKCGGNQKGAFVRTSNGQTSTSTPDQVILL